MARYSPVLAPYFMAAGTLSAAEAQQKPSAPSLQGSSETVEAEALR